MAKSKKELLASAPWRASSQDDDEKFKDARLKVTSQPGTTSKMHVPGKKKYSSGNDAVGEDSLTEIDPELRYSFQRNYQNRKHVDPKLAFLDQRAYDSETWIFLGSNCIYDQITDLEIWWEEFLQRVFSIDTVVKPLPPAMAYNVSRNLTFFTRIFTQFFDPEGIADAQKSLGLGQEEKVRKVR